MSGLPVSHVGEKVSGGVISTGSPTVHVGSSAVGLADRVSACVPLVGQPPLPTASISPAANIASMANAACSACGTPS